MLKFCLFQGVLFLVYPGGIEKKMVNLKNIQTMNTTRWLFADSVTEPTLLEITGFKIDFKTAKGKTIDYVLVFTGLINNTIADYYCALWNISLTACYEAFGEDETALIGKKVYVKSDGDKIIVVPA